MNYPIHIIAEAGTNNNGSLEKAKNLVNIAFRSGADSVKFQMINTWGLYLPGKYDYGHYNIEDVIKIRQEGEMKDSDYKELSQYSNDAGIPFSASVFDEKSLKLLASFKPPYIKLASCDLNNVRFLRQVADCGIKVVMSTGMSTMKDIEIGVEAITKNGFKDLVLLHCVSVYPSTIKQTNLRFIQVLKKNFGYEVGFSDHTGTSHAACMALTFGATWFEKHFTEDKTQKGLDHAYAMEEVGLKSYVNDIHEAYEALILKEDKISDAEKYTRRRARRSLYASKDLPIGHTITNEDVLVVRPENILQADEIDSIIGKTLSYPLKQHEPFSKDILK
jgi:N,N'-diacetyllegionaminate synthase